MSNYEERSEPVSDESEAPIAGAHNEWELERQALLGLIHACARDKGARRIFPPELAERILRYVAARRAAGLSRARAATELELQGCQVRRWLMRGASACTALDPARVGQASSPTAEQVSGASSYEDRVPHLVSGLGRESGALEGQAERKESAPGIDAAGSFIRLTLVPDQREEAMVMAREGEQRGTLVAISPTGWRVEGLTLAGLAFLMNAGRM